MFKKISKYTIFYALITIFFLLIFLLFAYWATLANIIREYKDAIFPLIALLPVIIFGIFTILSIKGKLKKWHNILITILLSFVFCVVTFFNFLIFSFSETFSLLKGINDIKYYYRVMNSYQPSVFPDRLPKNSLDTEFYYNPQFFQGGSNYILLEKYNDEDFEKEKERLKNLSAEIINKSSYVDDNSHYLYDSFEYYLDNADLGNMDFNYYIVQNINGSPELDYWNHGLVEGCAVNEVYNIIIYYYSQ